MLEMPGNTSLIPRLYVCKLGEFKNKAKKNSRENQQGEVEAVLGMKLV